MTNITFFETKEELEQLTGLNHDELWHNDFNLDDWDWGFVSDKCFGKIELDEYGLPWHNHNDTDNPTAIEVLLTWMDNYCVGYEVTEYDGKYYFILHHA